MFYEHGNLQFSHPSDRGWCPKGHQHYIDYSGLMPPVAYPQTPLSLVHIHACRPAVNMIAAFDARASKQPVWQFELPPHEQAVGSYAEPVDHPSRAQAGLVLLIQGKLATLDLNGRLTRFNVRSSWSRTTYDGKKFYQVIDRSGGFEPAFVLKEMDSITGQTRVIAELPETDWMTHANGLDILMLDASHVLIGTHSSTRFAQRTQVMVVDLEQGKIVFRKIYQPYRAASNSMMAVAPGGKFAVLLQKYTNSEMMVEEFQFSASGSGAGK